MTDLPDSGLRSSVRHTFSSPLAEAPAMLIAQVAIVLHFGLGPPQSQLLDMSKKASLKSIKT